MRISFIAFIALVFCAFTAGARDVVEGNGKMITKVISVDNYDRIALGGNIEYTGNRSWGYRGNKKFPVFKYTHGRHASLKVTIDENLFSLLNIKSGNGEISIYVQDGTRIKPTDYVIEGSSRSLKYLKVSGPMDFEAQNAFSEDHLEIRISGSSDVNFPHKIDLRSGDFSVSGSGDLAFDNLNCGNLTSKVTGSGDIDLKGKADEAQLAVSGSGDIKAYNFSVKELKCSVSGSGDARVYATENMRLSVSGSGDIRYKGPANVDKSKSGSGSIKRGD